MKRDPRLRDLSSEHHQALVLGRMLTEHAGPWQRADGDALHERFERELEPHFRIEEELLLPALRDAGCGALATRTADDHARVRALVAQAHGGDGAAAHALGALLVEHVRFEEREMFPACEQHLASDVLEAVARRTARRTS